MGYTAAPLEKLIEEFSKFPGIGRKGATRMAYQVLSMSDEDAAALAGALKGVPWQEYFSQCEPQRMEHFFTTL